MNTKLLSFPVLRTERLILRRPALSDTPALMQLRTDPSVNQYLERKPPSLQETETFIKKIDNSIRKRDSLYWIICLKETAPLIGTICLWNFNDKKNSAEIGYELMPAQHRKGLMAEAASHVIAFAFKKLQLDFLTAFTHPDNLPSSRLLERHGFKRDLNNEYANENEADGLLVYFLRNSESEFSV